MKRLARLVFATGLAASLLSVGVREAAFATPFSDVPANHWAYQYVQSLAADGIIDGYPDGKFKGDRPLTRYEMAAVVARAIAKLQENQGLYATKDDLDKLQKLIDALKDELDALGVRVTNLEDSLDALDKRTKFAQSLSMHGVFLPNVSMRQRPVNPTSIVNQTGAAVATYYGTTVPCQPGVNGCAANANPTAVSSIDPFINAFMTSDDSNSPLTQAGSGIFIRQDSRFSLAYAITDNLTISLPVHVLNYEMGGEFTSDQKVDLEPGVDVNIAKTGAISNLHFKFGQIDDMTSSRTGLTFRAPLGYSGAVPYLEPLQPVQKGVEMSGTIAEGAFGSTDFQGSFTRLDQTYLLTATTAEDPSVIAGGPGYNGYLFPVVAPSQGLTQTTPAGALTSNTYNAGSGTLTQVFLAQKAVNGSVYISYYNGATFSNNGTQTGGPAATTVPGFTYNDAYNSVVFATPLPAGSVVTITYRGLVDTNATNYERYMIHGRLNQKFKGLAGLEVGLNFNRIFDFTDTQTSGSGPTGITFVNRASPTGYGLVSDTVAGVDFQLPIPYDISGPNSEPILFGEAADSKFTADYNNVAAVGDTAGVIGLRFKIQKVELSAQYQSVGVNFMDGAPFHYYGNAPALFAFYKLPYLPDFFGFANNLGINKQFDGQFANLGLANPNTSVNPNLTFLFPAYNTMKASGPEYFSSFAPNTRGLTASISAPIRIGDFSMTARGGYSSLQEIRPNSLGALLYGPAYASNALQKFDTYSAGLGFTLPVFGQKANVNLNASYERLTRPDQTAYAYYPINPSTGTFDGPSYAALNAPGLPGSQVSFYPNYENMKHITIGASGAIPVTTDLTLAGSYSTQRFGGEFGTTLNQNVSERKDFYTGSLTYSIPKTNSSLSFTARRYQYTDDVMPTYNFAQNRQDVNFTVRF